MIKDPTGGWHVSPEEWQMISWLEMEFPHPYAKLSIQSGFTQGQYQEYQRYLDKIWRGVADIHKVL